MIGRCYLLNGEPVVVLTRWEGNQAPRNVLLLRPNGAKTVRPFRGLRRMHLREALQS